MIVARCKVGALRGLIQDVPSKLSDKLHDLVYYIRASKRQTSFIYSIFFFFLWSKKAFAMLHFNDLRWLLVLEVGIRVAILRVDPRRLLPRSSRLSWSLWTSWFSASLGGPIARIAKLKFFINVLKSIQRYIFFVLSYFLLLHIYFNKRNILTPPLLVSAL